MTTYTNANDVLLNSLLQIVTDANEIEFHDGSWISFNSKGRCKRTKKCIAKYDNFGIKTILKQVDVFKPMRYMINGQPISNCEIIY